jgi:hypothetical protein
MAEKGHSRKDWKELRTTPKATTMLRCIQEAREFIRLAEAVPTHDTLVTKDHVTRKVQYIESGKASGLMKGAIR